MSGIEQLPENELRIRAKEVVDAWVVEGPAPLVHRRAQRKLEKEWPTLARAVKALVRRTQDGTR